MNSFFAQLYIDLTTHLNDAVGELKWIEQDFGQENDELRPNVAFPAALIDFPRTDYTEEGELCQMAVSTVTVKLLFAPYTQSYSAAPDTVKQEAISYYETEQKVVDALHGWQPSAGYCEPLVRISATGDNKSKGGTGLRIRTIVFTTAFEADENGR